MTLTTRESYVLGWVFGRISAESPKREIGGPIEWAAQRPFSGLGKIIFSARQLHLLSPELDDQIGEALNEINRYPEDTEEVQPLENQCSWDLGYYAGKSKRPLSGAFDIAQARKTRGITQAQLANIIGVDQALISRWESGKISPNAENLQKLKDALN